MKKGFTLIELLVVIAIIAIIAGLVIVRIGNSSSDARTSLRKAQIGEIGKAINIYLARGGQIKLCDETSCNRIISLTKSENAQNFITNNGDFPSDFLQGGDYPRDPSGRSYLFELIDYGPGQREYCILLVLPSSDTDPKIDKVCNKID